MAKVELEATSEACDATLDLADAEAIVDLTDAATAAYARGARELVFDLRTPGHPAVPILQAIEAVADALDALGPTVVRCLVASERVAAHVRERLRATEQRSSRWRGGGVMVQLRTGDIIAIAADAVVNASNTQLRLGAGVSAALRRACGPALQAEMSALAPIEPGGLAVTSAHELMTASRILHVATASGEADVIRRALANVLVYARDHALGTVGIPALGMGTGGLSREACCASDRSCSEQAVS
jgi:O-acetyl-ADP-ribose deacetylase